MTVPDVSTSAANQAQDPAAAEATAIPGQLAQRWYLQEERRGV
ncbi:hypothetical protein ACLRGI_06525 [Paenarthrobacter nitroguajacolicus]